MPGIKREQGFRIEGATNTRQDRNLSLTDGGTLTWNAGTGVLTWSNSMLLRIPGFAAQTIAAGSATGITTAHQAVYVTLNRSTGAISVPASQALSNAAYDSDERVVLAIRGADGKLYFRNGSVFTSGDSKSFGSLNSVTDRNEVTADGLALQAVGFTYVTGSKQLAVFVGGVLQKLTTHYTETSSTQITFTADHIPGAGEEITFLNVVGGQGPPGAADLQTAYASGNDIDVVDGTPFELTSSSGTGATVVERSGHAVDPGGVSAYSRTRDGQITVNRIYLRDYLTGTKQFVFEVDSNGNLRIHSTALGAEHGVQINDDGSGVEFGTFPALGSTGTTGGSVEISSFSGTTSAVAATSLATGLTTIKGVQVSVFHPTLGRYLVSGFADGSTATREFYVTWTAAGVVTISGASDGTGVVPAALQGQPYKVVVFH